MGELGDLLEKSEIKFPRSIKLGEARSLMMLLAEKLPAYINYSFTTIGEIKGLDKKPEELKPEEINSRFGGSIAVNDTAIKELLFFQLERAVLDQGLTGYGSLKFQLTPGYGINEYTNEVETWDKVRASIEKYFSQRDSSGELMEAK